MMNLVRNKYHIVRHGDFATNGTSKLLYGIFAATLCLRDYYSRDSLDVLTITLGATAIWTLVEIYLHFSKTRVIKPMFLGKYSMQIMLPPAFGAMLRGLQEGGLVCAIGLYYGDRLDDPEVLMRLHLFIAVVVANVWTRRLPGGSKMRTGVKTRNGASSGTVASKRVVNTRVSMLFIGGATAYDLVMMWRHPEHVYRQLCMLGVMVYVCGWWTVAAWYKGFRTIEIHLKQHKGDDYDIKPVNVFDTVLILGYDVLFEIGAAYMIFYNLFMIH